MSKSILLSIRPEQTEKILSGEKTIEIRKKFPKDYVGWVYIYCTKGKYLFGAVGSGFYVPKKCNKNTYTYNIGDDYIFISERLLKSVSLNGKVVARFWCDKVDTYQCDFCDRGKELESTRYDFNLNCKEIYDGVGHYLSEKEQKEHLKQILAKSCLNMENLVKYLAYNEEGLLNFVEFYCLPISRLEIFDRPRELSDFGESCLFNAMIKGVLSPKTFGTEIKKAPKNYRYIEE